MKYIVEEKLMKKWYRVAYKWGKQYKEQFFKLMDEKGIKVKKLSGRWCLICTDIETAKELEEENGDWLYIVKNICGQYVPEDEG